MGLARGGRTELEPSPPRRDRDACAPNQAMIPGRKHQQCLALPRNTDADPTQGAGPWVPRASGLRLSCVQQP